MRTSVCFVLPRFGGFTPRSLPIAVCRKRFKDVVRDDDDVYPGSWEGDSEGLLFYWVKELKTMMRRAARQGHCLIYADDA